MQAQPISGIHGTWIVEKDQHRGTVFIPWETPDSNACSRLADSVSSLCHVPFRLVLFPVLDWDGDLTPWPAPGVFKGQHFGGFASQTLSVLLDHIIPTYSDEFNLIAGYSLAGLFSLWALTQTPRFRGAASCSGSLWYPGFTEYMRSASLPADSLVYLSLGDLEEKARNPVLRTIGQETRHMAGLLSARPEVQWSTLVMNPGNHFAEPDERLSKGIAALINHLPSTVSG